VNNRGLGKTGLALTLLIIISVVFLSFAPTQLACTLPGPKALSYDEEVIAPYLGHFEITEMIINKEFFEYEKLHPLRLGYVAFLLLHDGYKNNDDEMLSLAREYLDFLADSYPLTRENEQSILWQYPNAQKYRPVGPGWYSGMANSAIAIAFLTGYEVFGEERYMELADKAINGVILPIGEGGCALSLGPEKDWFLEYAWDEVDQENAEFALNGFLLNLLTLRIFADITDHDQYLDFYNRGLSAIKELAPQFYFPENDWTYYNLQMTIESPHYAMFDLTLYNALYQLTADPFFLSEIETRKNILGKNYPLTICLDKDGSYSFLFSAIGPPHPHWIDIGDTKIAFFSEEGEMLSSKELEHPRSTIIPLLERAFITGQLPDSTSSYAIYQDREDRGVFHFQWYEGLIVEEGLIEKCESCPKAIDYNLGCAYDTEYDKDRQLIVIDPAKMSRPDNPNYYTNTQGRIILKLPAAIERQEYKYLSLTIKPSKAIESIRFTLVDTEGNRASRYYAPLQADTENLVLLHWVGFEDSTKLGGLISQIEITVFTSKYLPSDNFTIELGELLLLENNLQLYNYLKLYNPYFPEKPLD
jgi:hypothetical protein